MGNIGQYFTGTLLGEPFIVVRDDKNEIRAFYNVCRHHAAKIVDVCKWRGDTSLLILISFLIILLFFLFCFLFQGMWAN